MTSRQPGFPGRVARALDAWIETICWFLSAAVVLAMTVLITVDVLGRYFLGKPTMVAVELSGYMLVGLVFVGLVHAEHLDRNIRVEIFTNMLPGRVRNRLATVVLAATMAFSAWLAWFALEPVLMDYALGTTSLTGTAIPIWIPSALIPLGFTLVAVKLLVRLWLDGAAARRIPEV